MPRRKMSMTRPGITGERMAALFFLGLLLFNPPLLGIFDAGPDVTLLGVPLLYLYIFLAWGALVLLMFLATIRLTRRPPEMSPPPLKETVPEAQE